MSSLFVSLFLIFAGPLLAEHELLKGKLQRYDVQTFQNDSGLFQREDSQRENLRVFRGHDQELPSALSPQRIFDLVSDKKEVSRTGFSQRFHSSRFIARKEKDDDAAQRNNQSALILESLLPDDKGLHPSESEKYALTLPGDSSTTFLFNWAPRYINVTDIRGFDDSFTTIFISGMHFLAPRFESIFNYRVNPDWSLSARPSFGASYGIFEFSSHQEFNLQTLPEKVEVPSHFNVQELALDLGTQAGVKYKSYELFMDYRSLFAFRFQRVRASRREYISPGSGFIDNLSAQVQNRTRKLFVHTWGLGFAWHFGREPWNYRLGLIFRPASVFSYGDKTESLDGFGIDLRAGELRLTDDVGLALGMRWDFWLPSDHFNNAHYFEISVGVRFS